LKKILIIFLFYQPLSTVAQEHYVGLEVGLNLTEIADDNFSVAPGIGGEFGIVYQFRSKYGINFSTGLASSKSTFKRFYLRSPLSGEIAEKIDVKNYSVPISIGYTLLPKNLLVLNLGLTTNFKYRISRRISSPHVNDSFYAQNSNTFGYSLHADISMNILKFSYGEIYSLFAMNRNVRNNYDLNPRSSFPRRILTYNIMFGYRIRI